MLRPTMVLLVAAGCARSEAPDWDEDVACAATCAATEGDGSALAPRGTVREGPRRVLVLVPPDGVLHDDVRKLAIHLEGFGLRPHIVPSLDGVDLTEWTGLVVAHSSWSAIALSPDDEARIAAAVREGTDLLWIGSHLSDTLAPVFGVEVRSITSAAEAGIASVTWRRALRGDAELAIHDTEHLVRLVPRAADVTATFEPSGDPAMASHRADARSGRTVILPFGLAHYWGEDRTPDAWARAELLHDATSRFLAQGAALLAPMPHGHHGAFLVRVEDLSPGGTVFSQNYDDWIDRFADLGRFLDARGIPMNLSIIARYADPANGEEFGWDDPLPARRRLRDTLRERLRRGDALVAHGWTHQYGVRETDYTGLDWEFSDDSTGEWVFLPYARQHERIRRAMRELTATFDVRPEVWETPHLEGNLDTYRAAAEVGFPIVNEEDGHLFPNRWGELDTIGGHALNVPHTASFVPMEDPEGYVDLCTTWTMPRLTAVGAPFFLFHHGFSDEQTEAVRRLARCAVACRLWTPTVPEMATWWEDREQVGLEAWVEGDVLAARVTRIPHGLTIDLRLPDGTRASQVRVDGRPASHEVVRRRGVDHVRVVLEAGAARHIEVAFDS